MIFLHNYLTYCFLFLASASTTPSTHSQIFSVTMQCPQITFSCHSCLQIRYIILAIPQSLHLASILSLFQRLICLTKGHMKEMSCSLHYLIIKILTASVPRNLNSHTNNTKGWTGNIRRRTIENQRQPSPSHG